MASKKVYKNAPTGMFVTQTYSDKHASHIPAKHDANVRTKSGGGTSAPPNHMARQINKRRENPSVSKTRTTATTERMVYWQDAGTWIGYFQNYPDYWTQGETLADLKNHLRDLYRDLTSGELPGIRKVADLVVS